MDLGLNGKIALVTGASAGLGFAVARLLASEGADVAIAARRPDPLHAAAQQIRDEAPVRVLPIAADVTYPVACQRVVDTTVAELGGLDILIANAGGPPTGTFLELSDEQWQYASELNLMSTVRLIRAAVPAMQARGGGRIVVIASLSAKQPLPNLILSNTMRAGILGLAKSLANELAPFNILVNAALPGWTRTDRVKVLLADRARRQGISEAEAASAITSEIPLKRMAEPEEFAAAVVFLASARASYITGVALQIDGGQVRSII